LLIGLEPLPIDSLAIIIGKSEAIESTVLEHGFRQVIVSQRQTSQDKPPTPLATERVVETTGLSPLWSLTSAQGAYSTENRKTEEA
jgi:hypothetical protein